MFVWKSNRTPGEVFRAGVRMDREMSKVVPMWKKVLFLLSNAPYFWVALWMGAQLGVDTSLAFFLPGAAESVCRAGPMYAFVLSVIGCTSVLMHSAQMRLLGGCLVCAREDLGHVRSTMGDRLQDSLSWQGRFKKMDVGCVFGGMFIGTVCLGAGLARKVLPVVPVFILGQVCKAHGAWGAET
eukprot:g5571.t1